MVDLKLNKDVGVNITTNVILFGISISFLLFLYLLYHTLLRKSGNWFIFYTSYIDFSFHL